MPQHPRFRYFLLTPTSERGSPILSYEIQRTPEGEEVFVQPERQVTAIEFSSLKAGFLLWHTEYLKKPTSEPVMHAAGGLEYTQRITSHECYAFTLYEPEFFPCLIERLSFASSIAVKTINRIHTALKQRTPNLLHEAVEWEATVALVFAAAAPMLLIDELLLRKFEGVIAEAIPETRRRSLLLQALYSSRHLEDVVVGKTAVLPQSKAWSTTPPRLSIPNSYDLAAIIHQHWLHCQKTYLCSGVSPSPTNSILHLGPKIFMMSEAIHYNLGALLLAGNHLWVRLQPPGADAEDWKPLPTFQLKAHSHHG